MKYYLIGLSSALVLLYLINEFDKLKKYNEILINENNELKEKLELYSLKNKIKTITI